MKSDTVLASMKSFAVIAADDGGRFVTAARAVRRNAVVVDAGGRMLADIRTVTSECGVLDDDVGLAGNFIESLRIAAVRIQGVLSAVRCPPAVRFCGHVNQCRRIQGPDLSGRARLITAEVLVALGSEPVLGVAECAFGGTKRKLVIVQVAGHALLQSRAAHGGNADQRDN